MDNTTLTTSAVIKLFENIKDDNNDIDIETIEKIILDIDINSALNKINRETSGRLIKVVAENQENTEQAKEINKHFSSVKMNRIINHMLLARLYGYSGFEIIYNEDFTISSLIPIPHKYLEYKNNNWYIKANNNEIVLNREKFLLCIHGWNPCNPKGKSILNACKQTFLDKERYTKQLRGLAEKYGDVITVFPYDDRLTEREARKQLEFLKEIKGTNVIGVPLRKGDHLKDSIEFIKLSDLDPNIYTSLYAREKEKILQNILGSTLTMESSSLEGKGTQALGEVHEKGFTQVVQECCNFIIDSLYQLLENDGALFGYDPTLFTWELEKVLTKEDKLRDEQFTSLKLDNINKLSTAGYELETDYLGSYLGIDASKIIKKKTIME